MRSGERAAPGSLFDATGSRLMPHSLDPADILLRYPQGYLQHCEATRHILVDITLNTKMQTWCDTQCHGHARNWASVCIISIAIAIRRGSGLVVIVF